MHRQSLITLWHHRKIIAGSAYASEIDSHLNAASLILLLVSSDFIYSDYCYGIEIKRAMERHSSKEACVIPILLRPVDCEGTPFGHLQVLPANGKPITSWQNEDEAFLEITRGIRKAIESWKNPSINNQTLSQTEWIWNIPYQRNLYFTGQEPILKLLHDQFKSHPEIVTRAISGLGGIGKTQIAIEYAYRYREEYQAVLWAKADTHESLVSDYISLAILLGISKKDDQDQSSTVVAVKYWLDTHYRWLLILDNADNIMLVNDFLPKANNGHILLTTRAAAQGSIAQGIELAPMELTEGAIFLLRRTRRLAHDDALSIAPPEEQAAAEAIVQALGGLPLALDQAGAYIEETGCGLAGYLERYQDQASRPPLLKRRGRLAMQHPEPIATTWSMAFLKVEMVNPAAAAIMRLCPFLHPDAIPEEFITAGAPELGSVLAELSNNLIAFDEAVEALRDYSLVIRHPDTRTFSIHRLVQAVLHDGMAEDEQRQRIERIIRVINKLFPSVEFDTWPLCERYLLHAQVCAMHIINWNLSSTEAAHLLDKAGTYLYEHAQYSDAEPLLKRALSIRERMLGPNHTDIASSLKKLGELYYDLGKYTDAEPLYLRALHMCEQLSGSNPNHPDTASYYNNLADLYVAQGKYAEAEPLYQRALSIREQMLGPNHSDTASSLNNLGMLYEAQGKYAEAEPLLLRALSIREQMLGPDHPDTANSLGNLAKLYEIQGKYSEAELLYLRALSIYEQKLGANHNFTAMNLNNLAKLYEVEGSYAEAEPLYQRALEILEQVMGSEHPDTVKVRENYASFLLTRGS